MLKYLNCCTLDLNMKTYKLIPLLLLILLAYSCYEEKKSCKIFVEDDQNMTISEVKLSNGSKSFNPKNENGYFIYSPEINEPEYFVLTIGSRSFNLYLAPGYNISVPSGIGKDENNSRFSGKGALQNNYIMDDAFLSEKIQNNTNFDSIYSLSPSSFIYCIDSLYNLRALNLEKFIKNNGINDTVFILTERKRIFYSSAFKKNQYYRDHKFLTGEIPSLDREFDCYLEMADFNDSASIRLLEYKKFLNTYFERAGLQDCDLPQNFGKEIHFSEYSYAIAKRMIYDKKVKNYVLYKIIDLYINDTPVDYSRNLVFDFNKECTDNNYKELISNSYIAHEKLKKGMPAPEFTFPDTAGRQVSLSDFRGRLVFIDVWNSNCSPCFKEFPVLEQLIRKYRGEEIVFVGISYDSDETLWKKTMKAKDLKGVQLLANGWDSRFGKDYMVWSNPRFILIDRNGNFISARAPKPSENADSLIEQNL
jgi:peroxiredoxin